MVDTQAEKSEILEIDNISDVAMLQEKLESIAKSGKSIIHIVGGIKWFDRTRWTNLNIRRENISSKVRARLIFWLNAEKIGQFATYATDFWSWRSGIYRIAD